MCGGGSGGSTNYSDVTQTTSNLPEYAEPYYRDLLARTGFETAQPYQAYQGQRMAGFSPGEQEAMARYNELGVSGTPDSLTSAGQTAYDVSQGYGTGIEALKDFQRYTAGDIGDLGDYAGQSRDVGYANEQYGPSYEAGQRNSGYGANRYRTDFEAGNMYGQALDPYQDQYMQDVVDIEKRELSRQADMRHAATGLDAAGMGSLGSYREAIMRSEAERNLSQQMGDVQTQGSQQAFFNAQKAYEADRQARAMQEQFGQSAFGMNEQARQAQEQFAQSQFGMNESARQAQEQYGQSAFGMNEAARQAQEQFEQSQFGLNASERQFGSQLGIQAFQAQEAARQQATQLGLSEAEIEQAGQIAAANAQNQQQQTRLAGADMLGAFSGQQQSMEMERLQAMQSAGMMERGMQQAGLDMGYEDFLRQQSYPREQLAFYSAMMQGTPIMPGQTTATYGQQPSYGQQMMGMGIAGAGLYNATNQGGWGG